MDNTDHAFVDWLNGQMRAQRWTQSDLARAAHLDTAVISNILNKKRGPGIKTCTAIARALRISPDIVLQAAGLLYAKRSSEDDAVISEINEIYEKLTNDNQIEALEYFRMKLRVQEERDNNEASSRDVHSPHDKKKPSR